MRNNQNKFLELIKQKRIEKGFSQEFMGRKLHIVCSAYGKIERGQTELSFKRFVEICNILNIDPMWQTKKTPINSKTESNKINMDYMSELRILREITHIYKHFVNSIVSTKYQEIMFGYPYEEFTAEDWWKSLGENKEEKLGMTEIEFWATYSGGYEMVYKPEDKYNGFKKLMEESSFYYFFKFGFIEDEELNKLFNVFIEKEDTNHYPLNIKLKPESISNYLDTMTKFEVFKGSTKHTL